MKNRVMYRVKGDLQWAEIALVGQRPLLAKVDAADVAELGKYRWGWHPRGVYCWQEGVLLSHVLLPDAREVFFQNGNKLDCRRDNMVKGFRRPAPAAAKGVIFDRERGAYVAYCHRRGLQVHAYFAVADFPDERTARRMAEGQRESFLRMSYDELVGYKAGRVPVAEHEVWLGDDVAGMIAERVDGDPVQAAFRGYQAGLMASRVIGAAEIGRRLEYGKRNGRAMVAA